MGWSAAYPAVLQHYLTVPLRGARGFTRSVARGGAEETKVERANNFAEGQPNIGESAGPNPNKSSSPRAFYVGKAMVMGSPNAGMEVDSDVGPGQYAGSKAQEENGKEIVLHPTAIGQRSLGARGCIPKRL